MLATLSLVRREFSAYFLSPIAYVVLAVFLAVTGHLFYLTLMQLTAAGPKGVEYPMQLMLGDEKFWLVYLFIPPLLTMRLFAEERSTGTLEMLMTAPLTDWQVVLSKYFACFAFYIVLWLPTLAYLPALLNWTVNWRIIVSPGTSLAIVLAVVLSLTAGPISVLNAWRGEKGRIETMFWTLLGVILIGLGLALASFFFSVRAPDQQVDPMPIASSYLGLVLAGSMFLALGLFVSSLVRSQMVAALISLFLSLGFIVVGIWRPEMDTGSMLYRVLFFFSVPLHFYRDFSRGLVDTRHLVLYVSVAMLCLFLTVRSLESRRWR
jgi:ABC-type transport system involved in multi-copper enzyme maturation permease subunit